MKKMKFRRIMATILSTAMVMTALPISGLLNVQAASSQEHIDLTRKVAGEGMVLMENKNEALPIAEGTKVAMFGRAMIDYVRGGGGSGATNVSYMRNILQGMQMKAEEGKISLYQPLVDFYTEQVSTNGITNDANITVSDELLNNAAAEATTAVVTIGRYSSEGSDRTATKGDYYLSDAEEELLTRVAAKFDKTVVVLNVGAVLDTSWIDEISGIDAVLMGWQAGMEGGLATADVLVGDVNPSGKFVDTFAKTYTDYPGSDTFNESSAYVNYTEDIFVGYRYFETFDPSYEKVNYEFGYGLSYTTFTTDKVSVSEDGENITVKATVTNTGEVAGKQVVQVYFSAPQGLLGKPAKELVAFAKTKELAPGESEELTMKFAISDMSSYDDTGKVQESAYVMEAGDYNIYVGNSIKDAGEKGVRYTYKVDELQITEQLSKQCAPNHLEKRLLADGSYETLQNDLSKLDPHYTIKKDEQLTVEAYNFIDSSENLRVESYYDPDTYELKYCLAYLNAADRYVEYDITAEEAGKYEVIMCQANGYPTIQNCFGVTVNGVQQIGVSYDAEQTGDGNGASEWYNFEESDPFYINLEKGANRVRFTAYKNNPNYAYIKFKRVGDTEEQRYSKVITAGENKIEAESYDATVTGETNQNVRTENFTKGEYSGTCVAYMNHVGNSVSYHLYVEEAGEYDVILNASNGRAGFDFDPGIDVNGTKYPATITAQQTGDGEGASEWYNFEDLTPVTVTLPKGNVILTLTSAELDHYPNFDYIKINKKASLQPASAENTKVVRAADTSQQAEKIMLLDVYNKTATMSDFLAQLSDEQLCNLMGGQPNTGVANTGGMGNLMEYGIPNAMTADGPQGIRIGTACTAWPISTLLASTWDVEILEKVGKAAAKEAHENNIDIWLAPGMNIHRDPLCGRNFEYYSEDPLISGKMAAAITKGCQSEGVSITLKHFTTNNKEVNRNSSDSRLSERALREIYLKGFEIAVKEANPWSIMTSYNFMNGVETSENKQLLTNITRGEWGYEGIFMTDWGNQSNHAREVLAGNDVKMPTGSPSTLMSALEKGIIKRENLEASAERLMNLIMKVNVFQEKIANPPTVVIGDDTYFKAADNIIWSQTVRGEVTSDTDGGNNLGYCDAGGYAQYQINVTKGGTYLVSARSTSNVGEGKFDVLVDGVKVVDFTAQNTGGWQNWITLDAKEIALEAGAHTLRIEFTESGSNLNWLHFERKLDQNEFYREKLQQLYDVWAKEELSEYKTEGAAALRTALTAAKAVLDNSEASASEIQKATNQLIEASGKLEYGVNKVALETAIEAAEAVIAEPESYNVAALKEAVAAGKLVLNNADVTQEAVNEATIAITDCMKALAENEDASSLVKLVNVVEQVLTDNSGKYTEESAAALQEAIDKANAVLAKENATAEELDKAYSDVIDAVIGLKMCGNKAALKAMIEKADAILAEADKYVAAGVEVLRTALPAAKEVYNSKDVLQSEVNEAVEALTLKIAEVRLLGDVDNDGEVTTKDTRAVLRTAAELDTLSVEDAASADVNSDGAVDTKDAVLILRYAAELVQAF